MWFHNVRIVTRGVNEGFSCLQDSSQKLFCYHFKTKFDKITDKKLLKLKGRAKYNSSNHSYISKYIEAKLDEIFLKILPV